MSLARSRKAAMTVGAALLPSAILPPLVLRRGWPLPPYA